MRASRRHFGMTTSSPEIVSTTAEPERQLSVAALASALGRVFGSPPGRTWVRVLHPTCCAWLHQPTHSGELER